MEAFLHIFTSAAFAITAWCCSPPHSDTVSHNETVGARTPRRIIVVSNPGPKLGGSISCEIIMTERVVPPDGILKAKLRLVGCSSSPVVVFRNGTMSPMMGMGQVKVEFIGGKYAAGQPNDGDLRKSEAELYAGETADLPILVSINPSQKTITLKASYSISPDVALRLHVDPNSCEATPVVLKFENATKEWLRMMGDPRLNLNDDEKRWLRWMGNPRIKLKDDDYVDEEWSHWIAAPILPASRPADRHG